MSPDAFENLLNERIGLNVESIGAPAIARAVDARQRACRLNSAVAYWDHIQGCEAELQELIEAVVVSETWFFRDPEAFIALGPPAEGWLGAHPTGSLQVLSIPCATGEEPHSIAIALLDLGFPPHRFSIDGVDISERAVLHARSGTYGNNSFRGADLQFRDRHFEPIDSGYRLSANVRSRVSFKQGNLFALERLSGSRSYDIVFCRNVLIYFDAAAQRRALVLLERLLVPDGLVFVGPAETALLSSHGFVSTRVPRAFAFHAPPRPGAVALGAVVPPTRRVPAGKDRAARGPAPSPAARIHRGRPALVAPVSAEPSFDLAELLADRGLISEAARICREQLRLRGPSARGLHLMGLLSEAAGNSREAAAFHRQALYLEPEHLDALHHLALLLDEQGNGRGAESLRRRALRLTRKAGET